MSIIDEDVKGLRKRLEDIPQVEPHGKWKLAVEEAPLRRVLDYLELLSEGFKSAERQLSLQRSLNSNLLATKKILVEALEFYRDLGPEMASGVCLADDGDRAKEALEAVKL